MVNMSHYETKDGTLINDIVVKKELTDNEELELLKSAIIDGFSSDEWKLFQPHHEKIFNKYKNNIEKIKKLESKIEALETANTILSEKVGKLEKKREKIEKIKAENIGLKELLGKGSSGWEIKGDNVAVGLDPFTKEVKQYGFPKNFDEKKANDLHFTDDNFYLCHFKYYYDEKDPWPTGYFKEYDMPITLYDYLCSRSQIDVKTTKEIRQTSKKGMPNKFKSPELLLQYFRENLGKEYYSYSLINIIVPFIFENIKKPFCPKDASEYCKNKRGKKPVDATIHKHFNLLIEHGIIRRKYHGVYEVIERSINFD